MLITLLATGTRGDTQPYLALGVKLKEAGCTVRVAAFKNFETLVKGCGLEFYQIQGDVAMVAARDFSGDGMKADNPLKFLVSFNKLKSLAYSLQKEFFNACAGSDAIVYHPGAAIGYFIAQYLHIPSILATPFPMTPTRAYPSLIFYDKFRPNVRLNYLTHKILEQIMWFASSSSVKQFWKKEFGRLPENFTCPFPLQSTSRLPTIISCSSHVFPSPADWKAGVHQTGYWFLNDGEDWTPPAALLDFLKRGAPPVYVGFGSAGDIAKAEQTTNLVIDSLKQSGQRGVLATGWDGMAKLETAPQDIFILESAPHSWLFPRMSAVVHHGGAGTTAAGFRAGVPSIIIPSSNDQFAWGRRAYELGVGSQSIPRKSLTSEKLAAAIHFASGEPIKTTAQALGVKIRDEHGAEAAAQIILNCVK